MRAVLASVFVGASVLGGCAAGPPRPDNAALSRQVAATERAFALTMAARDHAAFASFLSSETVFFSGDKVLRGSKQVADTWARYYAGPQAPFSWEPERVEVLDSGTLALSSGPVHDPQGRLIGTFNSIWRLEAPGKWRIIFDKGNQACGPKSVQ